MLIRALRRGFNLRRRLALGWARPWILLGLICCLFTAPAAAIDIVIQLGDEGENPSYDPNGTRLKAIFNAAAAYWEDYLPASKTYEVDIFWSASEFEGEAGVLARWNFQFGGDNNIRVNPNPGSGSWFLDPTPLDNSEFDFETRDRVIGSTNPWEYRGGTWLYGDVTSGEQSSWFGDSPHDLLEIGYRGRAFSATLRNQFDLLSTVIHELGHELGVNDTGGPWRANPAFLPSGSAVILENDDGGHVAARTALMCGGCGRMGTRRLPSAIDIMAVADDEGFGVVDFPRQDFVGTGSWNSGSRWFGGAQPDSGDVAFVREGARATLTNNAHVKGLAMSSNGSVNTQNRKLTVDANTTIEAFLFDGPNTEIIVPTGGELETGSLEIAGGKLTLAGGLADLNGRLLIGAFPGVLRGHGSVQLSGPLLNEGELRADNGTMTINAFLFDGGVVNLDGDSEQGFVNLTNGDLVITGTAGLTDAFDGTMTIGPGHSMTIQAAWTLGAGGQLTMQSQGLLGSAVKGGTVIVRGSIDAVDFGAIEAPAIFESTADVEAGTNAILWLNGLTTFRGGSFSGRGWIVQNGDAIVETDTQIDVDTYDMDGSEGAPATITIEPGQQLRVNSRRISTTSDDGFDGSFIISGGTLQVHTFDRFIFNGNLFKLPRPWRMEGTLNLSGGGQRLLLPARIDGSRMIVGDPGGQATINVGHGGAVIEAPITFEPTASISIASGETLELEGSTIYQGGTLSSSGQLQQTGNANVTANTTIRVGSYDMDGANEDSVLTIDPRVELRVDSWRIEENGGSDFDGKAVINGGILSVKPHNFLSFGGKIFRSELPWRMEGTLELNHDSGLATVEGNKMFVGAIGGPPIPTTGGQATVEGNKMFIGQPDTSKPVARIDVGPGQANLATTGVEFEPRSEVAMVIGGPAVNQFSRLHVADDLVLDGTLVLSRANGFTPDMGDAFFVLSVFGDFTGTFAAVDDTDAALGLSASGFQMEWLTDYDHTSWLELLVGVRGDLDLDGDVDFDDINDFLLGLNDPAAYLATVGHGSSAGGDLDGDGDQDFDDIDGFVDRLVGGSPIRAATSQAVPEPGTCLLVLTGLVLIAMRPVRIGVRQQIYRSSRRSIQRPIWRAAWRSRFSFSTRAMRTYPSPAGPKPLPGLSATSASLNKNMEKSMVFISPSHVSGILAQTNMLALGASTGQPIRSRLWQRTLRRH